MEEIKEQIKSAAKKLFKIDMEPELTRPDEQFGDYATNVALQLAKKLDKKPHEIAKAIVKELKHPNILKSEIAGPGFINITLSDEALAAALDQKPAQPNKGKEILVEFGDPNPFKEMHIGHLYSYIVGESISRLLEATSATVHRLSYHGDIGLHVAKAIWGMQQSGVIADKMPTNLVQNVGIYYQKGAQAYEENENAKAEIGEINEHIYKRDDDTINKLYDWGKKESFKEFDAVLEDLKIKIEERYLESESAETGVQLIKKHTGKIFKESEGAVVYDGEKVGLHTRVFITSKNLPTYEAKDLGLAELKNKDFPKAARSIIITAHEQSEYFKVMLAALKEIDQELASITTHLSHGFVSLTTGKMSSRKGEVYTAIKQMVDVEMKARNSKYGSNLDMEMGAIKYGFLKHRLGSDIVYDPGESVSLEGNSGPYLQYAHARARSILRKSKVKNAKNLQFDARERTLARKIGEYSEVVEKAVKELMPHHIATYLYELAQTFNSFYENNRVVGDKRENVRRQLVESYAETLKKGLSLLNISAPEKM